MKKRTILDTIEIAGDIIMVRFAKQVLKGKKIISNEWHRTTFESKEHIDQQMKHVNEHLKIMGFPSVSKVDINKIKKA